MFGASRAHTGHFIIRLSVQLLGLCAVRLFARDGLWLGLGYGVRLRVIERLDDDEAGAVDVGERLRSVYVDNGIRFDGNQFGRMVGLLVFGVVDRNCLHLRKVNGRGCFRR